MSSIGENFRTHLLGTSSITDVVGMRIHQSKMPEGSYTPAIWFQRSAEEEEVLLDGRCGVIATRFDLECISTGIDQAIDLGKIVKDYLHGARGTFSGTTAIYQGIFVRDKDDDYLPRNEGSDSGRTVAALDITVWAT
jgi:hypothetical protein